MGFARERVVPPAGKGAWVRYGGLGLALGALCGLTLPWLSNLFYERVVIPSNRLALADSIDGVLICVLLLVPLAVVLRVTQRWSVILGFAFTFILANMLVLEGRDVLGRPSGGADSFDWTHANWFKAMFVAGLGFAAVAALLRTLCRVLVVRTAEQGPDDCAWCGYTRGSAAITRCPECGRDAANARYRMHRYVAFIAGLATRWKVLVASAGALLVVLSIQPIRERTIPAFMFYARFPGARRDRYTGPDLAVWIPESPGSSRGLAVRYMPVQSELKEMCSVEVASWLGASTAVGSGHVVARLKPEQIQWVLAHGLPDGLTKALYAKADDIAWTAQSTARGEYPVDPTPFFPK